MIYSEFSKARPHPADKENLLQTLFRLGVFSPQKRPDIERYLPFFDKAQLRIIDYLTIWDLLQLAGYDDQDVPLFAVLLCMFDILQEGSLCLNLESTPFKNRLEVFATPKVASDTAEQFLTALDKNQYADFISRNHDHYKPLVLSCDHNRKLLYFQKYFVYEKKLEQRIRKFLKIQETSGTQAMDPEKTERLIEDIFSDRLVLRISKGGPPIAMDFYQVKAIKTALSSHFCIVSGGPGTGKTSLMVNILRCFIRGGTDPSRIILCAPTGRAAQRMTEAIHSSVHLIQFPDEYDTRLFNIKASTIHKTLHYRKFINDFYYREQNRLPASLVIMDEVSMVDVVLMEKFLRAIDPSNTRLILLGDKDQLPSVEAGAIFGTMIPGGEQSKPFENHLVVLKNTYRSGEQLQHLAGMINEGKMPPVEPVSLEKALTADTDQWSLVHPKNVEQWQKDMIQWTHMHLITGTKDRKLYPHNSGCDPTDSKTPLNPGIRNKMLYQPMIHEAEAMDLDRLIHSPDGRILLENIFRIMASYQILTIIKQGIWGSIGINSFLSGYISHQYGSFSDWQNHGIFSGAFIIIVQNDYGKELFNGDSGVVIKDSRGVFRAFFKRFDSFTNYSIDLLPAWEMSYALTVHKCQGSEFDDILLVLPADEQHRLLTRQMIYTAVTRAKKRVIIYGKPASLKIALKRKIQRESGLNW